MPDLAIYNGYDPRQLLVQSTDPMRGFMPGLQQAYDSSVQKLLADYFTGNVAYMGSGAFTSPSYPGKTIVTGAKLVELIKDKNFLVQNTDLVKQIQAGTSVNAVAIDTDGVGEAISINTPPPPPKKASWLNKFLNRSVGSVARFATALYTGGLTEIQTKDRRLGSTLYLDAAYSSVNTGGAFVIGAKTADERAAFSLAGKVVGAVASIGAGTSVAAAEGASAGSLLGAATVKAGVSAQSAYSTWSKWEKAKKQRR